MALSADFVADHIHRWTEHLGSGLRPYRKHWPSCLFHHAPIENALEILRDAHLRARNDGARKHLRDVAAPGVIDNALEAHDRVRLYFRPRTPTQFHIEGIRKPEDCQYGVDTHAPILVMFVLDAEAVLRLPDVAFSDRNMQRGDRRTGSDEAFFNTIPFEKVFHDSGIDGDYSIIAHRCAEVLPSSPLSLEATLRGIWFRCEPERDTLLHLLGSNRAAWEKYCRISEELKVFDKRYAFLSELALSTQGFGFRINNRHDLKPVTLSIKVVDESGATLIDFEEEDFPTINKVGGNWIVRRELAPSKYHISVKIEGQLAYQGSVKLEDSLV